MAKTRSELWTQTIFTITPQENGMLREINETTSISGHLDTNLQIDATNIAQVKNISSTKNFIDPGELSRKPFSEAECQTYIQNVRDVQIPIELINEATQTLYIGKQCPAASAAKDVIATISKRSIPLLKSGQITQTIISFDRECSEETVLKQLFLDPTSEQEDTEIVLSAFKQEVSEIEAWHNVNYIIERAFWISDPEEPSKETRETEAQTTIMCNSKTGKAAYDQETQTGLTCRPIDSNSELLSDYLQNKNLMKSCLEDCLEKGVYNRIVVDDILDEVLDNCSQEIHLPLLEKATQTLTSYKTMEDKDDDILRKLRRPVAVDPVETKAVVVPLMEEILKATFTQASEDATTVVKYVICTLIRRSILIAKQLEENRKQVTRMLREKLKCEIKLIILKGQRSSLNLTIN